MAGACFILQNHTLEWFSLALHSADICYSAGVCFLLIWDLSIPSLLSVSPCPVPGCAPRAVSRAGDVSPGQVSLRCGDIPETEALALLRDGQTLPRKLTELSTQSSISHLSASGKTWNKYPEQSTSESAAPRGWLTQARAQTHPKWFLTLKLLQEGFIL